MNLIFRLLCVILGAWRGKALGWRRSRGCASGSGRWISISTCISPIPAIWR
ncbi:hypothetical protein GT370_03160 [Acidocella sp. MX-AZ03]|uniref:hypothetical protein n=1 Tax=Acidocella sp. MX-AZ03 TaxID=2697363 RepID=UPI0022DD2D5A|nr:hypothetical protein [Acidocella sp. MX-AZ03]WBO59897.1 hypothetical protein GT370_03160 [Acidocella sp. MX-AZ03]